MVEERIHFRDEGINRMCIVKRYHGPCHKPDNETDGLHTAFSDHVLANADSKEKLTTSTEGAGSFWGVLKRQAPNT